MPNFSTWLHNQPSDQSPALKRLQTVVAATQQWPYWSDSVEEYRAVLRGVNPPEPALLETLDLYYSRWNQQSATSGWSGGQIALLVGAFAIAALVVWGLGKNDFYVSLSKTEQARGLVTFLFVLTTTGVILITTIAIFYFGDGNDIRNRFAYAKDLLTVVIGVLGTIMGFYFGQATPESGAIGISDLVVAPSPAAAGKPFTLTGTVAGGKSPYFINVEFKSDPADAIDATKLDVKNHKSDNGSISETIPLPALAAGAKKATLTFTVSVKDTKGATIQSHGTLEIQSP